jgi:hypothetical protein
VNSPEPSSNLQVAALMQVNHANACRRQFMRIVVNTIEHSRQPYHREPPGNVRPIECYGEKTPSRDRTIDARVPSIGIQVMW